MRYFTVFVAAILALTFTTAASVSGDDLRLETFFKGRTTATGSFKAITGQSRTFTVDLHGRWDGKTLTLREDFIYDDGEKDTKTWRFTQTGWNTYSGTREDVIGTTRVTVINNKAYFDYVVDLAPGPKKNLVKFYDTLILSEDGKTLANTARVFKGPLQVAKVRVDFTR